MNSQLIPLLVAVALLAIVGITAYNTAFKSGQFTCNRYILNTYLYILLAIVIVAVQVLGFDYMKKTPLHAGLLGIVAVVILSFVFLLATMFTSPQDVLLKHLMWIGFLLSVGFIFYFNYIRMRLGGILLSTLLTVLLIVVTLSIVAFARPDLISLSWGPVLLTLLMAGIFLRIVIFFLGGGPRSKYDIMLSYGMIVLFSFYVLYDTKKIQVRAKTCTTANADYINGSLGIFLDILNLISDVSNVRR